MLLLKNNFESETPKLQIEKITCKDVESNVEANNETET